MRRATSALLCTAVLVPFLAACGADGGVDPSGAPATRHTKASQKPAEDETTKGPASSETPVEDPPGPAFPEGTGGQMAENSGEWDLVLSDVRIGHHPGFDRVVLEFTGTGTPGWSVNYVDEAVLDGSGKAVKLIGDSTLDIYATGTTYPDSDGGYYSGPRQFQPADGGDIEDVYVAGTFEGSTQVLAGITGDRVPFRVFALTDPSRLVVDVAHLDRAS